MSKFFRISTKITLQERNSFFVWKTYFSTLIYYLVKTSDVLKISSIPQWLEVNYRKDGVQSILVCLCSLAEKPSFFFLLPTSFISFLLFCLLAFPLSLLGVNKQRLCSVFFLFFSRRQASKEPDAVHTDMTISHWHRGLCKQWRATYVAKWEGLWNTPTLCSLAAHLIYKCIHARLCCHGSGVSVIGAQAESVH